MLYYIHIETHTNNVCFKISSVGIVKTILQVTASTQIIHISHLYY